MATVATMDAATATATTTVPRNVVLEGHVLDELRALPDACVQLVVSSPPYWSLRQYGTKPQVWGGNDPACAHEWTRGIELHDEREKAIHGKTRTTDRYYGDGSRRYDGNHQKHLAGSTCAKCGAWLGEYGQEETPDCWMAGTPLACGRCYVCHTVLILREVRRVLRPDGLVFWNVGDCYAREPAKGVKFGAGAIATARRITNRQALEGNRGKAVPKGLKPKDLIMMPHRVALALQRDGWWVRNDHPWEKENGMPESVSDRCTRNHEYVFMLAKSETYYVDIEAIAEPVAEASIKRVSQRTFAQQTGGAKDYGTSGTNANRSARRALENWAEHPETRRPRSVLHFNPTPFPAAHFAVFPEALPEWCIKFGSSSRACEHCGAPWRRVTAKRRAKDPTVGKNAMRGSGHFRASPGGPANRAGREFLRVVEVETTGWESTCRCEHNTGAGRCLVLDPFLGSGTTAVVAQRLERDWLGCELNPAYARMARRRVLTAGCAHTTLTAPEGGPEQAPLFAATNDGEGA